jgi:hypothetical protein
MATAAEQGVINGHGQRRSDRYEVTDDQPQHRQAHGVGVPAGAGEEPVRPAVMPHPGHTRTGEHAADGSVRRLGNHPGQQGHERSERRGGEARPERLQHASQRPR